MTVDEKIDCLGTITGAPTTNDSTVAGVPGGSLRRGSCCATGRSWRPLQDTNDEAQILYNGVGTNIEIR